MSDTLADRMKSYEQEAAGRKLDAQLPVIARLDGRRFSKFVKRFDKPFDARFTDAMTETCKALVEETAANFGYVQTDEVSLVWHIGENADSKHRLLFDGRVQKLCSVLAGYASTSFLRAILARMPVDQHTEILAACPHFDARVWTVPDRSEAANYILWRAFECEKNAISAYARAWLEPEQMTGLDSAAQIEGAITMGAPEFETVREEDRLGRYCRKVIEFRELSNAERDTIPAEHRPQLGHKVRRQRMAELALNVRDVQGLETLIFG